MTNSKVVLVNTEMDCDLFGKTWLAVLPTENPHTYESLGDALAYGLASYDEFPRHIHAFRLVEVPEREAREIWAHLRAFNLAAELEEQAGVDFGDLNRDRLELGLHLDPYVHDVASLEATGVNNDGLRAQLRYLFLHAGAKEVHRILEEIQN